MAASTESQSGSGDLGALPPVLEWAQRKDRVWITVALENCPNPVHELKPNTLHFKGNGGTENLEHEVTVELFAEIVPKRSTSETNDRHTTFTLIKKDRKATYWPRLTKEKKKFHFIKTDFNRWQDEDEDYSFEEAMEDFDSDAAVGDSVQPSVDSLDGLKGGEIDRKSSDDSDDEDLPDLG